MTFDPGMPMVPEVALFVLAVLVLFLGLLRARVAVPHRDIDPDLQVGHATGVGWVTFFGLLATLGLTFVAREGGSLFGGSFVNDSLAIFAKKLFIASAACLMCQQKVFQGDQEGCYRYVRQNW